jgi:hypothetical protein
MQMTMSMSLEKVLSSIQFVCDGNFVAQMIFFCRKKMENKKRMFDLLITKKNERKVNI